MRRTSVFFCVGGGGANYKKSGLMCWGVQSILVSGRHQLWRRVCLALLFFISSALLRILRSAPSLTNTWILHGMGDRKSGDTNKCSIQRYAPNLRLTFCLPLPLPPAASLSTSRRHGCCKWGCAGFSARSSSKCAARSCSDDRIFPPVLLLPFRTGQHEAKTASPLRTAREKGEPLCGFAWHRWYSTRPNTWRLKHAFLSKSISTSSGWMKHPSVLIGSSETLTNQENIRLKPIYKPEGPSLYPTAGVRFLFNLL